MFAIVLRSTLSKEYKEFSHINSFKINWVSTIAPAFYLTIIQVVTWTQQSWWGTDRSTLSIQEIAGQVSPQMRGVIRYYGKFKLWALQRLMWHFEFRLVKWVLNKYKKFKNSYTKAYQWIKELNNSYPTMFYYWTVFNHVWWYDRSRMKWELHVRFCERLGLKCPCLLDCAA